MAIQEQEVGSGARGGNGRRSLPGIGLLKGLGVTLRHMLHRSVTQQYPHVKPDLPARTRGVIALKTENCTVCYKCSRACPDWCIYIDAHKEQHTPASGGRGRSVKLLDRFAIDYALCMYCGICVEVCPFDALFWSPEFEYAEFDIVNLTHEKERLEEWTYHVLPPPALEIGAEPMPTPEEAPVRTGGGEPVASRPPSAAETSRPGAAPPAEMAPPTAQAEVPVQSAPAASAGPPSAATAEPAMQAGTLPSAAARTDHAEVEPDQETFDRVLAEEVAKGTDRRVAEGRAKAAAIRAARRKAAGG